MDLMRRKNVFFKINFDLKIYYDNFFNFDIKISKLLKKYILKKY